MRILGGWIALTPEISAKLLMGRHVWDSAQHADLLGRRLPELRAQAQVSEPPNEAFVACLDAIEAAEHPEQTVERLVGIYRVLKPHLAATYEAHLQRANEVYEPPTRRILTRCLEDERRHISAGIVVLRHLVTTSALELRASRWRARIEELLVVSGGVSGQGIPPSAPEDLGPTPGSRSDDGEELIGLERAGVHWAVPEGLEFAVERLGAALIARDRSEVARSCLPGVTPSEGVGSALASQRLCTHRMVALAAVGHQRLVKLRLEGPDGAVVIVTRWVPDESGWRAAVLDLAAIQTAPPA